MTDTTTQFRRQLPRNLAFQVLAFGTHVGVGIWLVPYLVGHLGMAAYGLIPIAGMLTEYVSLISHSISRAVNRFLTIALQREDAHEANRIFSTAFFAYLAVGVLQIPLFALLISLAGCIIAIPDALYHDAVVLLICSAGAFVINLVASVFGVPMYAYNRLDLARVVDITRYLLKVGGVVALFTAFGPTLRFVGYVDLSIALFLLLVQSALLRRLAPGLRLRSTYFAWDKIRQLVGMGGWLLVSEVGVILFLRMDVWVCNRFVGPEAAGEYAALLQWPTLIRHGGTIISAVVAPMIVIYYARDERERLIRLSNISVRLLSLLLAVPIAVLCASSPALLTLWLGEPYAHLAPVMVIMLCHLVINVGCMPLLNIQVALDQVKVPAIVTLLTGALNLIMAIAFVRYFQWGVIGVAIAGAVVLTLKNALFTPLYVAAILRKPWHTFLTPYMSALGLMASLTTLGVVATYYTLPNTWAELAVFATGIGAIGLVAAWFIPSRNDRQVVISLLRSPLSRAASG